MSYGFRSSFRAVVLAFFLLLLGASIANDAPGFQSGGTPAPLSGGWLAPDGGNSPTGDETTVVDNSAGTQALVYRLSCTTEETAEYVVYDSSNSVVGVPVLIPFSPTTTDVTVPAGGRLKVRDPKDSPANNPSSPAGTYLKV